MTLSQASQRSEPQLMPQSILLVEDELLIRLSLSEELRDQGYRVVEACSADEALVMLEASTPDLIITDVRMPGSIDGMGLLAVVRRSFPTLPVIVVSGHLQAGDAFADGATVFVPKPFLLEVVVNSVAQELAKS